MKNRESSPDRSIIHYSLIFTLFTIFKQNVSMFLSWCDTYFLRILFLYFFILQTFYNICFFCIHFFHFFLLQTLFCIYFFYILFFCLFVFQTNHHIFLLLVYSVYLYCFCSIILLYLALILRFFDSRSNRHYSPLFIYL